MVICAINNNTKYYLSDKYDISNGVCFWTEDLEVANKFLTEYEARAYMNPTFKNILNQVDLNSITIQDENFNILCELKDFYMLKYMDITSK